jgi:hypothetical protein
MRRSFDLCECSNRPFGITQLGMSTIHCFPPAQSLDPTDLDLAAAVYIDIVQRLTLSVGEEASRETIAQSIIDRMLLGERDPIRLRDGALARLGPSPND